MVARFQSRGRNGWLRGGETSKCNEVNNRLEGGVGGVAYEALTRGLTKENRGGNVAITNQVGPVFPGEVVDFPGVVQPVWAFSGA